MERPAEPVNESIAELRIKLREASRLCTERGLLISAKWAAELLNALPAAQPGTLPPQAQASSSRARHFAHSTPARSTRPGGGGRESLLPGLPPLSASHHHAGGRSHARDSLGSVSEMPSFAGDTSTRMDEDGLAWDDAAEQAELRNWEEQDQYDLALAYYRTHELERASRTLKSCSGTKARWLRVYSRYLSGERKLQEEGSLLMGQSDKLKINPFVKELLAEMNSWEPGTIENDGWLLYLNAVLILALPPISPSPLPPREIPQTTRPTDFRLIAMDMLIKSIKLVPYNWSAWLKLTACLDGPEDLDVIITTLPPTYASWFFFVHASLETHSASESLHQGITKLGKVFPRGTVVDGMRALLYYNLREFDLSGDCFKKMQEKDPCRVEDVDIYSNILYVTEQKAELAKLAQDYTAVDRARPEVCCVVGNYFSLRRDHEKAILYFRRALKLDRSYLSAWTLMGHEYIEIKNTGAATESYRRAVDVNRKDYRAWYGLGQTYELLGESFHAINYYQRATALRPYDARMWGALAGCYEKIKRIPDAIKAYQRALFSAELGENDYSMRIAKLEEKRNNPTAAKQYYRRALAEAVKLEQPKNQLSKMWIWLAKWEMDRAKTVSGKGGKLDEHDIDLVTAEQYLRQAAAVQEDKDEATDLLKELETMMLDVS